MLMPFTGAWPLELGERGLFAGMLEAQLAIQMEKAKLKNDRRRHMGAGSIMGPQRLGSHQR
jgi:hypothetical protein